MSRLDDVLRQFNGEEEAEGVDDATDSAADSEADTSLDLGSEPGDEEAEGEPVDDAPAAEGLEAPDESTEEPAVEEPKAPEANDRVAALEERYADLESKHAALLGVLLERQGRPAEAPQANRVRGVDRDELARAVILARTPQRPDWADEIARLPQPVREAALSHVFESERARVEEELDPDGAFRRRAVPIVTELVARALQAHSDSMRTASSVFSAHADVTKTDAEKAKFVETLAEIPGGNSREEIERRAKIAARLLRAEGRVAGATPISRQKAVNEAARAGVSVRGGPRKKAVGDVVRPNGELDFLATYEALTRMEA